ncbi:hypothetical protein FF38_02904 [Lucilia cuprina]|uniref:Uncharacterized protein n=1 Tax=Lucilia cuprina TaxID=7375 RepID=A0A0L0C4U8_LUCCU|nr:hypothetical protein FF38_02904 [Lucilia cuprina]
MNFNAGQKPQNTKILSYWLLPSDSVCGSGSTVSGVEVLVNDSSGFVVRRSKDIKNCYVDGKDSSKFIEFVSYKYSRLYIVEIGPTTSVSNVNVHVWACTEYCLILLNNNNLIYLSKDNISKYLLKMERQTQKQPYTNSIMLFQHEHENQDENEDFVMTLIASNT